MVGWYSRFAVTTGKGKSNLQDLGFLHRENPRKNQNSPICVQKMDVYADWTLLGTRNLRVWHRNCPQTPSRRPFFEYVRLVV